MWRLDYNLVDIYVTCFLPMRDRREAEMPDYVPEMKRPRSSFFQGMARISLFLEASRIQPR